MAEYQLIQERTISGKGALRVPTDFKKTRAVILYTSVIREPKNKYLNKNWNPPKSRYGNLVFLRQSYVMSAMPIEYDGQAFDAINDICGQSLIAIKCMYEGVLQTFVNLGVGIAGTPGGIGFHVTAVENKIKDYQNLGLGWDEVKICCYADTALSLRLMQLPYDNCNPDDKPNLPPPPPPPPPAKVPPGTPVPNSPAYNPDNNDGGDSVPYPGDNPAPPPSIGTDCQGVKVTCKMKFKGDPTEYTRSYYVYGPFLRAYVLPNGTNILMDCRGPTSERCDKPGTYAIEGNSNGYDSFTFINAQVV